MVPLALLSIPATAVSQLVIWTSDDPGPWFELSQRFNNVAANVGLMAAFAHFSLLADPNRGREDRHGMRRSGRLVVAALTVDAGLRAKEVHRGAPLHSGP